MTKQERARLRSEMSKMIANLMQEGERVTTGQICELAIEYFPDLVDNESQRLLRASITNMARQLLKEASKEGSEDRQVSLFHNEMQDLKIQKCIAVPAKGDSREIVWVSTLSATRADLRAYVSYLRAGASADMERAKALASFDDMIGKIAISDDLDTPIEDLVYGLKRRAV